MALRLLLPLLMLAATLLFAQAQGIGTSASDCCLKYSQRAVPIRVVTSYTLQGPESGCLLRAVVFTTRRGKKICSSPTDPAVQKTMKNLDKKNDKDKKKEQSQRSGGKPKRRRRQQV
ncbi:C-C motif chemokine 21-like [Neopelma chrysocephalum]|uniref:C-C motif chemokine 21-like n=1 Tax=Neopelma chrysocephalum TaxID=114329 RepID=UPI000FCD1A37|nr:C-C motif chemokine 21-like [Neopelma chrysocephalum]